jgi:hypothetical protein
MHKVYNYMYLSAVKNLAIRLFLLVENNFEKGKKGLNVSHNSSLQIIILYTI